jgi:antitoxin MazE
MQVTVQKWDNNLALCIPKAAETCLENQSVVDMSLADGKIIIAIEPQLTLDDLLAGITDENMPDEINTGPAMGKEVL